MLTRIQNIAHTLLEITQKSTAKFDTEPTKWSWAKRIGSYDAVPDPYNSFFKPLIESGKTFPYTVQTPAFDRFMFKSTEKLVCDLDDDIVVLEKHGDTFETQRYPIERISYFEIRTILLDCQIKLYGVNSDGVNISTTLKFNSVTDYLFEPLLQKIRLARTNINIDRDAEVAKFDHLMKTNFKFMNYARRSILAGEKVIHFIFQPEITEKIFTFLGNTYYKTIHPTHMVTLTDHEFIMIHEEKERMGKGNYGGTWTYIQLNRIKKLSISAKNDDLLTLSIQLSEAASLDVPFQVSAKEDINQLLTSFDQLIKK
ncbi:MAG: hypothetical protein IPP66_13430 [Anaerolineales bacterium]|nr:hypothetical protein [Anaerolineales bacterium]